MAEHTEIRDSLSKWINEQVPTLCSEDVAPIVTDFVLIFVTDDLNDEDGIMYHKFSSSMPRHTAFGLLHVAKELLEDDD